MAKKIAIDFKKASKIASRKPPLPKKGIDIFSAGPDWRLNARLNFLHDHDFTYTDGYRLAGNILSRRVKRTKRDQDTLIYPIVFLYRHHLELRLKGIIRDGYALFGEKLPEFKEDILTKHDLNNLWKVSKDVLTLYYDRDVKKDPEALLRIEECIMQFHKIDPGSFSFRYATDKKGVASAGDVSHVNVAQLQAQFSYLAKFLDAVYTGITITLDMEREYKSNMAP